MTFFFSPELFAIQTLRWVPARIVRKKSTSTSHKFYVFTLFPLHRTKKIIWILIAQLEVVLWIHHQYHRHPNCPLKENWAEDKIKKKCVCQEQVMKKFLITITPKDASRKIRRYPLDVETFMWYVCYSIKLTYCSIKIKCPSTQWLLLFNTLINQDNR
jgi:hypothetical protein